MTIDIPEAPEGARRFFGGRLPRAETFAAVLADTGVSHGLIGPREVPILWERHILNCAVIEDAFDRVREEVNGPRTLDVDLLVVGNTVLDSPELTLPHPRAHERAFVLVPWLDADPRAALATGGRTLSVRELLAGLDAPALAALLDATVVGSLERARELLDDDRAPLDRLLDLARFDAAQLVDERWNLGSLYLLPEVGDDRYAQFRTARSELAAAYETLAAAVLDDPTDTRSLLPFRLVESMIMLRSDEQRDELDGRTAADLVDTIVGAIEMLLTHESRA